MDSEFGFLSPQVVFYLVAFVPVAATIWFAFSARSRAVAKLIGGPFVSAPIYSTLLLLVPLLAAVLALGRPYVGHERIEIPVPGNDYMFVVDISQSMLAKDFSPSRIAVAKRKMLDLIQEFTRRGAAGRFGITLFAGSAYLFCPITSDTTVLRQFIDTISPGLVTSKGSNISAGIEVAIDRLTALKSKSGRLLILSDGEDGSSSNDGIVEKLKKNGIKADSIGLGTLDGVPIETRNGSFIKDARGQIVISALKEDILLRITRDSGGVYVRGSIDDGDVTAVANSALARFSSGDTVVSFIDQYGEVGPWIALFVGVTTLLVSQLKWLGLSLLLAFAVYGSTVSAIFFPITVFAQESSKEESKGDDPYQLFQEGQYQEAARLYKERLGSSPNNRAFKKGLAASLFRGDAPQDAAKLYGELAESAQKGFEFFDNKYNQGNALLKARKLPEAIDAFDAALKSKPNDTRALQNKGIAQALIEEEQKRKQENKEKEEAEREQQEREQQENFKKDSESTEKGPDNKDDLKNDKNDEKGDERENNNNTGEDNGSKDSDGNEQKTPEYPTPSTDETTPSDNETQKQSDAAEDSVAEASKGGNDNAKGEKGDTSSMPPSEAELWIESLPDSPLLLRRHGGPPAANGQAW